MASSLHVVTPLMESISLSKRVGRQVYLKMENVQPSGSFKIRGIGRSCQQAVKDGAKQLICASGGNAGLAVAYAGRRLNVPTTIVIHKRVSSSIRRKLEEEGATVEIHGEDFDACNEYALQLAKKPGAKYIHPFDDPLVWEGHVTMIQELKQQIPQKPSCVIAACGGGGLLCGCIQGLKTVGWEDIPIVAMETHGADCFNASIKANCLVTLPEITSVCNCLGAKTVARKLFDYVGKYPIFSYVIHDKEAIEACRLFLDDHFVLVDSACGAALAAVYGNIITEMISKNKIDAKRPIVAIVCGGTGLSFDNLRTFMDKWNIL